MAVRVRIVETGAVFEAPAGVDLLEVLQQNGYPIATSCGGVASCGLCRVTVKEGKSALTPIKPEELTHLGNVAKVIGTRLACQTRIRQVDDGAADAAPSAGPAAAPTEIVLSVPEVEDVEERRRRKSLRLHVERTQRRSSDGTAASDARPRDPQGLIEWRPRRVPPKSDGT